MIVNYTDNPHNISELYSYIIIEKEKVISEIFGKKKCYFYDTCSFRGHANLDDIRIENLLKYIKDQKSVVIITRCILMELASHSGVLNHEYIKYIKHIYEYGIPVLVIYEEDLFSVMEVCFNTNTAINEYLCWAVRTIKRPVSTITETIKNDKNLISEVTKGKNNDNSGVYKQFFKAVRKNKESGDNLGEELLAICLHILSYLPGEDEGKFCVITDDKGATSLIYLMIKNTSKQHKGKDIGVFSTPKLVQVLFRQNILKDRKTMIEFLSSGTNGNIVVLGLLSYDIRYKEIVVSKDELADLIMTPNGINIIF